MKRNTENNDERLSGIIEGLREVNQKYITAFLDLRTHFDDVDEEFYITASNALSNQYKIELALRNEQARAKTAEQFYLARGIADTLEARTYRRYFRKCATPMKRILDERIEREAAGHYADLTEGLTPD